MWNDGAYGIDTTSAFGPLEEIFLREPRTLLASTLVILRPEAAQALVSQEQMGDWMDLSYDLGQMVCPGDASDKPQGNDRLQSLQSHSDEPSLPKMGPIPARC